MVQDESIGVRVSKAHIAKFDGLDCAAGDGVVRFQRFGYGVLDQKEAFRGCIGLEQARDHEGQVEGRGQRRRRRKGQRDGAHGAVDAPGGQHAGAHEDEDAREVYEEGGQRGNRLPVQREAERRAVDFLVGVEDLPPSCGRPRRRSEYRGCRTRFPEFWT